MSKEQILKKTMDKLQQLDKNTLKEANDFVDFLLTKVSNQGLTKKIQTQAEEGETFAFLKDEEELYSIHDLKEIYKK
jgi:lipoprotein NlpI